MGGQRVPVKIGPRGILLGKRTSFQGYAEGILLLFFFFLRGLKDKTRGYIALTRVNVSGALVGGKCISVSFLK